MYIGYGYRLSVISYKDSFFIQMRIVNLQSSIFNPKGVGITFFHSLENIQNSIVNNEGCGFGRGKVTRNPDFIGKPGTFEPF